MNRLWLRSISISAKCYHFSFIFPKKVANLRTAKGFKSFFGWGAALLFLLAGVAFLPHLGIENDEAVFAAPLFQPQTTHYSIQVGQAHIPLMLVSYAGSLKAWLYRPIFDAFGTTVTALRLPVILAGAITIWLFFRILLRIAGLRAANIGCILLALDSTYLLTTTFDWGPVALQHLLLLAGTLMLLHFYKTFHGGVLLTAFFLFGLAIWDKALALWLLSAMAIGGISALWRQFFVILRPRWMLLAALGLALGSLPLIIFNVDSGFATFRENTGRDASFLREKALFLKASFEGEALSGWMIRGEDATAADSSQGSVERRPAQISAGFWHLQNHLMFYGFMLALLLAPLARGVALRTILFGAIALAVAWLQMATTVNSGASVHHTVLLWPLPHLVIAVSLANASRRLPGRKGMAALVAVVVVVLAGSEALVMKTYLSDVKVYGSAPAWTDAIFPLADYLRASPARVIYCNDWGILDPLRLLEAGRLPLRSGGDLLPGDKETALRSIADPQVVWVNHTEGNENFPAWNQRVVEAAAGAGYAPRVEKVIGDRQGRPEFVVYRFVMR